MQVEEYWNLSVMIALKYSISFRKNFLIEETRFSIVEKNQQDKNWFSLEDDQLNEYYYGAAPKNKKITSLLHVFPILVEWPGK